jgi:prepilin-type N-terminal cleavage/methylation domain-containing protein
MKQVKQRSRKSGFTFAEVLIAAAIIGITAAFATSSLQNINNARMTSLGIQGRHDIVSTIVENIRNNVGNYQMSFNDSSATDSTGALMLDVLLSEDKLPFAWSNSVITTPAECPSCPGRYGYLIQPLSSFDGLFLVTVRLTNKDLFPGVKEYRFVTSTR